MSYCMYVVRQLNLTYPPTNWTEVRFKKNSKKMNKIKKIFLYTYLNNQFDEILVVIEVLEYQLKHNMLKVSIKTTGKNHLK